MNTTAGLWIDHRKAVIAIVSAKGEETMEIRSNVDKQPGRFAGIRSTTPYESQLVKADDRRERKLTGHLNQYYAKVIAAIRDAEAILILGPGEAKGELKKRLDRAKLGGHIVAMETTDKLTDRQIAAKARKYFDKRNSARLPKSVAVSSKALRRKGRTHEVSRRSSLESPGSGPSRFEVTHMKFVFPTVVLLLLFGTSASAYAQQEQGRGGHPQEARPAQQQARPAQHQQQRQAQPAPRQQVQRAQPVQQQHTQQATRSQQQQAHPVSRARQDNDGRSQARAQQSQLAGRNRGGNEHGRISNAHYATRFGSRHAFHVNRGDYEHRRFRYGGYAFGFVDPWPIGWGYSDDVYVEYTDGGYYMYNRVRPGVRISIEIL